MTTAELFAFIVAVFMAANAWITSRSAVRKNDFDALCKIVDELSEDNEKKKKEIADLRARVRSVEDENAILRNHNRRLVEQVVGLGAVPVPVSETDKP